MDQNKLGLLTVIGGLEVRRYLQSNRLQPGTRWADLLDALQKPPEVASY